MKSYSEILQEEKERTKNYSKSDFEKSIKLLKAIKPLFSETAFFLISMVPFLIGIFILKSVFLFAMILLLSHYIFYKRFAKSIYEERIAPDKKSIECIIQVLEDLKSEKYG